MCESFLVRLAAAAAGAETYDNGEEGGKEMTNEKFARRLSSLFLAALCCAGRQFVRWIRRACRCSRRRPSHGSVPRDRHTNSGCPLEPPPCCCCCCSAAAAAAGAASTTTLQMPSCCFARFFHSASAAAIWLTTGHPSRAHATVALVNASEKMRFPSSTMSRIPSLVRRL